jgi:hypothetical protein
MVTDIRLTTIDPAPPGQPRPATPCGVLLQRGLAALNYPPVAADEGGAEPQDGKPYNVQFVLNPKAWGAFQSTQPITIQIPSAKADMHLALRREAEAAYALGSWPMIDQLAVGVFGLERFSSLQEFSYGALDRGSRGSRQVEVLRQNVAEDRRELFSTFETVRAELIGKVDRCLALLESYAVCRAVLEELPACEGATVEEARRYLSLAATDESTVRRALAESYAPHAQELSGPEGRDLVRAIGTLAGSFRALQAAKNGFEATLPQRNVAKGAVWLMLLGPAGLPMAAAQATEAVRKVTGADSERKAAADRLARASGEFQARFAELAVGYPILFKIADAADQHESVLRRRTVLALQDSLEASAALAVRLQEEPEKVWRFPGLIDRSLRKGFAAYGGFASRVASDKLLRENEMPLFARLNAGIQLLATTLMLVPAPPVKLATAVASVIGDAAEMLESYFRTKEQKLGYLAAIDPGHALGPDGSYASTVIQGAFVALGLLPIPGAVREWAQESAEAGKAAALRKVALINAP